MGSSAEVWNRGRDSAWSLVFRGVQNDRQNIRALDGHSDGDQGGGQALVVVVLMKQTVGALD